MIIGNDFQPPVTAGAPTEAPSQELGQEDFLKLLMTQISNQDPLNPMESEQFMNQITAMNSLQQQISTNARLDDLVLAMGALNNETAVNLVGKSVVVEGSTFPHERGDPQEMTFELASEAATVDITVVDENGKVIANIEKTDMKAGENTVVWDGRDKDGNSVRDGDYSFRVAAKDPDENLVESRTFVSGVVDELRFAGGFPQIVVGGQVFELAAITRVIGGEAFGPPDDDAIAAAQAAADDAMAADAAGSPLTDAQKAAITRAYALL